MKSSKKPKVKYDYLYCKNSVKKSEDELFDKADQSLRKAYSDLCNHLHKQWLLYELGEGSLRRIRLLEKNAEKLSEMIEYIKD